MDKKSDSLWTTLFVPLLLALFFVALGVAATRFGTFLECSGAG
jgi:hypothetical protein